MSERSLPSERTIEHFEVDGGEGPLIATVHRHHGIGERPLVLVHGYCGSSHDWSPVVSRLADHAPLITFDHRGHGRSVNRGPYTFDQLDRDLMQIVAGLVPGGEPLHLLGHSMGGVVAMRYALRFPARVASLVLMDTAPAPQRPVPMGLVRAVAAYARGVGMGRVARQLATAARWAKHPIDTAGTAAFAGIDPEAMVGFAAELNSYASLTEHLPSIGCPTTIIVGERDSGLRIAAAEMAAAIAGAELTVIADAGHSPQSDAPGQWVSAVAAHLRRSRQPARSELATVVHFRESSHHRTRP